MKCKFYWEKGNQIFSSIRRCFHMAAICDKVGYRMNRISDYSANVFREIEQI